MTTLDLGELNVKLRADRNRLKLDLAAGEAEVKASGDRMGQSNAATALKWAANVAGGWKDAGNRAGDNFWRSADSKLRNASGKIIDAGQAFGKAAGDAAGAGMRLFGGGLGNIGTAATNLGTNLWNLVPALLMTAAAMAAVVPVGYLLGGLLGALPALATGGLAAVAVLGLGFMGLSDAFKKTSSAGGSVVDKAHQIMLAERRVRDANWEVLASQEAVNRARKTAAERMEDLTRSLAGAHLDEESAVAAVASAERDLAAARLSENPDRIAAADLALRQRQQALADVRDRVEDLTAEQEDSARKGVEGSDEVTAALDRQRKATEGVTDAQYELAQAQKPAPGGGGAAAEVTKLAPSALAAVAAVKSLKPAFESLRLDVQEKLFAGVGTEITLLADAWLPTLHTRLGSMAGMFNGLFKSWAETSKKPEFISNIAAGWEHVEKLIDRVGKAIVGPGLEAFGKLSKAAGPMLDAIGDGIGGIVEDFAKWIDKSEKSGALKKFFEEAGKFFTATLDIGKDVGSIIGSIFSIFFKMEDRHTDGSGIERLRDAMDKLAAWFKDPANQQKIADFIGKIEDFGRWIKDEAIPKVQEWIKKAGEWADKLKGWAAKAGEFKDKVVEAVDKISAAWNALKPSNVWDGIKEGFRTSINWIIRKWNSLEFSLPGVSIGGVQIGGGTWRSTDIPELADGGLVRATPGGTVARMAEAGQDEIVSPVDMMRRIVAEELARVQAEGSHGPDVIENHIHIGDEVTRVVRTEISSSNRSLKRKVTAGSGAR